MKLCPGWTVSRLVPSAAISAFSPAAEDEDRPSTATIAATPIAMPSADSAARSLRVRRPTLASRARSAARSRAAVGAARPAGRARRGWSRSSGSSFWLAGPARHPLPASSGQAALGGIAAAAAAVSETIRPSSIRTWRRIRGGDLLVVGDDHDRGPGGVR